MHAVSSIMKECWYKTPAARLSAFRIKKSLMKVMSLNKKTTRVISKVDLMSESATLLNEWNGSTAVMT